MEHVNDKALSVSAALSLTKSMLESVTLTIVGEVSEVSDKPGYKAVYFSIKDDRSSLSCMMWNNRYRQQAVTLAVGQLVELVGRFTLYAAKGRMNFDVFSLSLAGEGRLRMQVAETARRLQAEGLMDPQRKKPLPLLPDYVGLVTSPRGAAVHDVLRTLRRRYPAARVLLAGVPVEGRQAPGYIAEGIRCVVAAGAQVVLVVRGGGSFEDLMPFNDEMLARTIAACPVPLVTGIGHEPDTSIADMVADLRASTPTAAAEAASSYAVRLQDTLSASRTSLNANMRRTLERSRHRLRIMEQRPLFADSQFLFGHEAQTLDYLSDRLFRSLPRSFETDKRQLENLETRLHRGLPSNIARSANEVSALRLRLETSGKSLLNTSRHELSLHASRLHDLSPLRILSRGYAIARDESNAVIKDVSDVEPGSLVTVYVEKGNLACKVESVQKS